jgi:dihydrofolate reductase
MGRLTWLSIGRPLPGRLNIVLSSSPELALPADVRRAKDLDAALAIADSAGTGRCMVIGGAGVYAATLSIADVIHLTEIDLEPEGDTFFPELPAQAWRQTSCVEGPPDSPSGLRFRYITLERGDSSR